MRIFPSIVTRPGRRSRRRPGPIRRRVVRWLKIAVLTWLGVTAGLVLLLRWVDPPVTAFMIAAKLRGETVVSEWVDRAAIPPSLALAAVAAEDQRFPHHFGFDLVEIRNALVTLLKGGRMRGASTITQQLAKNLFLWSGRNLARKGLEAYFTVLLETLWSKQRILEVYLNVAQFGENIYGVGAASRKYFGTTPAGLTHRQMSLLVSVLPDPDGASPVSPDEQLLERAAFVRRHMQSLGGVAYINNM
jgi:monofunctional biosynthetic peptidoglycan transglycosylase